MLKSYIDFFIPNQHESRLVFVLALLCYVGAVTYALFTQEIYSLFSSEYNIFYILILSPFLHINLWHVLFNVWALRFLGDLLTKLISEKKIIILLVLTHIVSMLAHYSLSSNLAVGFSAIAFGMAGFCYHPFRKLPVDLILISMIFKLKPFKFGHLMLFILCIDVLGLLLSWSTIAHIAHLSGFATGYIAFWLHYKYKQSTRYR